MIPLILSGGSGIRLWPLSRENRPKQFIPLLSGQSMFQQTLHRLDSFSMSPPAIICNKEHRFLVADQCQQTGVEPESVFLEPVGRNTAPAITIFALSLLKQGRQESVLVLPADHYIAENDSLLHAIKEAQKFAEQGFLVTFGVPPEYPETGYGYIRRGEAKNGGFAVDAFTEKPGLEDARRYASDERYYWNSGMFLFRPKDYLDDLWRFRPKMVNACHEALNHLETVQGMFEIGEEAFRACPAESIDCAVMENTRRAVVVPLDAGWRDLGSWSSLSDSSEKDEAGNSVMGDAVLMNCTNTSVYSNKRLVTALDVSNLVLVETDDAILLSSKNSPGVKKLVENLRMEGRAEVKSGSTEYSAWGCSILIEQGSGFRVYRLLVNPGAVLTQHKHNYRTENWTVIKGVANVEIDGNEQVLTVGDAVSAPCGVLHQLSNLGSKVLELIEIQTGSILSEEDDGKN